MLLIINSDRFHRLYDIEVLAAYEACLQIRHAFGIVDDSSGGRVPALEVWGRADSKILFENIGLNFEHIECEAGIFGCLVSWFCSQVLKVVDLIRIVFGGHVEDL